MGRRGPARTPTAILKARGSWRGNSRPDEPQTPVEAPSCPRHLPAAERSVWKQVVPELIRLGTAARADRRSIERYCTHYVIWLRAVEDVRANGLTRELHKFDGSVYALTPNPAIGIADKQAVILLRLEEQFGLTPAARARLVVKVPEAVEPKGKGRFFVKAG